jgi:RHS repeat-associated protein
LIWSLPKEKQLFRGRRRIVISWHRFYDPETGRYITADPIGLAGGMNLYAYVVGDPVNLIDPTGLEKFCLWAGVSGDIVVGMGFQVLQQKGICRDDCGKITKVSRNCLCVCFGLSAGFSIGGSWGDDANSFSGWSAAGFGGVVDFSLGGGFPITGAGYSGGYRWGLKWCDCTCENN